MLSTLREEKGQDRAFNIVFGSPGTWAQLGEERKLQQALSFSVPV